MKREEKNFKMRRQIMDSALEEFAKQGYGSSSINTICSSRGISKGIIYHYFKSKDDLYLACVEECFQELTSFLRENTELSTEPAETQLEQYFSARFRFFQEHPVYQHIFCNAVIMPPHHLEEQIQRLKQPFTALSIDILQKLLENTVLRPDISKEEIIEAFQLFQDFINAKYQKTNSSEAAFEKREKNCHRALNILLYGVVERRNL